MNKDQVVPVGIYIYSQSIVVFKLLLIFYIAYFHLVRKVKYVFQIESMKYFRHKISLWYANMDPNIVLSSVINQTCVEHESAF